MHFLSRIWKDLEERKKEKGEEVASAVAHECLHYLAVLPSSGTRGSQPRLPFPGDINNVCRQFLIVTTWGRVVTGIQWVEARDLAKYPTTHRTDPPTKCRALIPAALW